MMIPRVFCLTGAAILLLAAVAAARPEGPPLGNNLVRSVSVATQSGDFTTPLDATPDPKARTIYFTARHVAGPGVFGVAATGGEAALWAGGPFVAPRGLVVDPRTGRTGAITAVVGRNRMGGGLHGPAGVPPVYAWADRSAGGRGQVYLVSLAP